MPLTRRLAAVAAAIAAISIAASPALADPISSSAKPLTPASYDIVGIGGGPTQYLLDQLSFNYDTTRKVHNRTHPYIYSWDSTDPKTGAAYGNIIIKKGCRKFVRPVSPDTGIADFDTGISACANFAPADRSPTSSDPTFTTFVALAQDNVTYATQQVSNAPHNLTALELNKIYTCQATNWDQFTGGKKGKIEPVLPETYGAISSTTSFLQAISVMTPGACVRQYATLPENVGASKILESKNVIVPYSTADYLTQRYHSAACGKKPGQGQNQFGCDASGTLRLNSINGTSPTTGSGARTVLNKPASVVRNGYANAFVSTLYDVVRGAKRIPRKLTGIFGPQGFFCSRAEQRVITDYGFEVPDLRGFPACGSLTYG
jgi:ABC-type phosphate transport system substrate-binding protein